MRGLTISCVMVAMTLAPAATAQASTKAFYTTTDGLCVTTSGFGHADECPGAAPVRTRATKFGPTRVSATGAAIWPRKFPKNPTLADVRRLGWNRHTPVDERALNMMNTPHFYTARPAAPRAVATCPTRMEVDRASMSGPTTYGQGQFFRATLLIEGGSGALVGSDGDVYSLGRPGITRVPWTLALFPEDEGDRKILAGESGVTTNVIISKDYGQAEFPAAISDMSWDLGTQLSCWMTTPTYFVNN